MNKSVIVVGAGVVGLACGKELSEKGYEVFIAEQEKILPLKQVPEILESFMLVFTIPLIV